MIKRFLEANRMDRVLLTLTSSESKRLIGKAIANLPQVKKAYKHGIIFIATSTSTAYVVEELLNRTMEGKGFFTAGVVVPRGICITLGKRRYKYIGVKNGVEENVTLTELKEKWLPEMDHDDVFIKGANAIDSSGASAILLGNAQGRGTGGTIAAAMGTISTRGVKLIIAAGLEKLVPNSLVDVAPTVGGPFKYAAGLPSGMMLVKGNLITEIQAFKILSGARAIPIASGGINGAEGCHTFIVEGTVNEVEKVWKLFKSIKGETPLTTVTENCNECKRGCHYNIDPDLIELRKQCEILDGHKEIC